MLLSPTLLVVFALLVAPLMTMVGLSFATQNYIHIDYGFSLQNYWTILEPSSKAAYFLGIPFYLNKPIYLLLLFKSILISLASTIVVILLAYPMAYFVAFSVTRHKIRLARAAQHPVLDQLPAARLRLEGDPRLQRRRSIPACISLGLISQPLEFLLYNPTAVVITLAHTYAAFAILPIYVSLEKIDRSLLEAAADLGDGPVGASCA